MKRLFFLPVIIAIAPAISQADESFSKYDANGDSNVTYVELAQGKKREFDGMDRDRSKSVSSDEFTKANAEAKPAEYDFFGTTDFKKLDADGNKNVTLSEFGAAIKGMIDALDTGADNAVSMKEYSAAVASAKAKDAAATPKKGSAPKGSAPKGSAPKKPSDT